MLPYLHSKLQNFFSRNIFERLICYVFLSELLVKIVFEFALGEWFYLQAQHKQYILYSLILLDYALTLPRVLSLRVTFNYISVFLLVFLLMIAQGVFVGLMNHNQLFEIFNDSAPLLVLILNGLRMQSLSENSKPIDFHFLLKFCTAMGLSICVIGQLSVLAGLPSRASIGTLPGGIYFPLFFAALLTYEKLPFRYVFSLFVILGLTSMDMNRTTMAFVAALGGCYVLHSLRKKPAQGIVSILLITVTLGIGWFSLPEDSGTYRRIIGLTELDFSQTTGSVGERGNEARSIQRKLTNMGETAELFGMGHGGLYEVQFTHEYLQNYGHAHYSWAMFNLRYGKTGYIYLAILTLILLFHARRNWSMSEPAALLVCLLCLQSFLYLMTYVNFVFLLAGLQFLYLHNQRAPSQKGIPAC